LQAAYLQKENVANGGLIPEDYLVTPQFNVPLEPELRFYSRLTIPGIQGSIYKILIVDLTTTPTADLNSAASYTELESWTEDEINPVQTEYGEIVVNLPAAYVGKQVRIAFMMTGDDHDRWLIDNVKVVAKCVEPLALSATNTTLNSSDLSWDNPSGATSWEIEVVGEDDVPTGSGVVYSGALPYHATALSAGGALVEGTCYKYYVRSLCDGGGESDWAGAYFFCTKRTGDNCSFPLNITSLPFSDVDDTALYGDDYEGLPGTGCGNSPWENYLSGRDVVYQYTATFTGAIDINLSENAITSGIFVYNECANIGVSCLDGGTAGWDGNPVSLEDFPVTAGEDYYIVISSYDVVSTPYQLIIQAVACDEPTNLSVGATTLNSATLSWDNPTAATSWQVAVQTAGSTIPSGNGTTVTDNSDYLWSGLVASTAYQYWVRADCGNGSFSAWAGPFLFNTQICDTPFQCSFTFTMWDMWDSWNGHTMSVKQNGLTIATLTGPGSDGEPVEVTVPVCHNMPVQLFWNSGGTSWASGEIGISVKNSFDQTIYVKEPGEGLAGTQLYEVVVDCEKPYCLPPENLTATNATQTTVDLGWAGDPTGEWDYYIVPAGSPAPNDATPGVTTTTNPAVGVGPLVAATNYEYYVRIHCIDASTPVSGWAGPFAFSSSVCAPVDKCVYDFVLNAPWDGWDDVVLTVRQNGTNVAVLGPEFTSGETMTVQVPLCNNVPFDVYFTSDGGWGGQVGLEIINNFSQTLFLREVYSDGGAGMVLFEDAVDCLHPKCLPPTDLASANGTMTSIDLSWEGPATGDWEYIVLPAGSPAPTAATPGVATTTNPTVGVPLAAPATNYDFYVRLVCTGATTPTSTWAGPLAIHSEVCDPADKCVFHFEMLSENGWGYEENTMTILQGGVPAAVIGPGFDWSAPNQDSMMVDIPLCPNIPIEIVWNVGGWDEMDKGLHVYSPFMEDVYIKDFGEGAQGETLFTGLVSCDPPACLKPLNLSVSDIELNSVSLAWDEMGTATSWEVWVLPYGSPAPTEPGTVVTENPVNWPGLESGTPYVFYVRANCETDGYSTWTGPFAFVTAIENDECGAAIDVPVSPGAICSTSVPGTLTGATASGMMPSCQWQEPEYDTWYTFTATGANHAVAITNAVGVEVGFAVYEGDDCGNLTEIACAMPSWPELGAQGVVAGLTPGETYYVQVYATYFPDPSVPSSFGVCVSSPASIIVDNDMPVEEIVTTALVVESCATFENITWSTGTNFTGWDGEPMSDGIGYFEKGLSTFGIEEGVVLMTGDAGKAPGPNLGAKLSDGGWPGDAQLFDYMTDLGIDVGSYNDATVLEFDFTPLANKLKFPFVFASEEYGTYQCSFSDAFAFFLTPLNEDGTPAGETTNLAVVPGTNSPVSVVTIRDGDFSPGFGCESVNPDYFDNYYGTDGGVDLTNAVNPMFAPINFQGATIRMSAESDVVAGQKYHIKLVIADRGDSGMDSAVFIGAFDIGKPDLGTDLTIADGNGICNDASYTIVSDLDPEDYTFTWTQRAVGSTGEFTVIPGETTNSLTVTVSGEYKLNASFGGLCEANDTVVIEFYPAVEDVTGNPAQMVICDADGFGTFNLSDNTAPILAIVANPSDYVVSYHLTAEDAQGDLNALPLTGYENTVQGLQEIYVRIVDGKGCVGIKSFSLVVQDLTPHFTINEDFAICEGTVGTISVTPIEPADFDPAVATYSWTLDGNALTATTSSITATVAGVYTVIVNNQGCPGTDSVIMSVTPTPIADDPADVVECTSYTLPALSANNNYYTGPGGTGTQLSAGDVVTSTQLLYVRAFSAATPECTSENTFNVTVIPTALVTIIESCQGNDYVLEANFDDDEIYNADNVTFEWTNAAGASLGSAATLTVVEAGSYFLTVTPAGQSINCPVTVEAQIDNTTCLIPRGISPNNDGSNDSFDLTTLDVKMLKIYNRYGQEVYSKRDYTNEFIGKGSNGDELPTGTYYYMIERSNGETKTGWVYINRQD
jgi:gliding motility-associated-like protein